MGYPSDWQQWASATLAGIGAPTSDTNLQTLWNWSVAESGQSVMRWNNPLNTTQNEAGAVSENSVGVRAYPDAATGVRATDETLLNGRYPNIVADLRTSLPQSQWSNAAGDLGTWGTGTGWLGRQAPVTAGGGGAQLLAAGGAGGPVGTVLGRIGQVWNALRGGEADTLGALGGSAADLAWRGGLIVFGAVLVLVGVTLLFRPVAEQAVAGVVKAAL